MLLARNRWRCSARLGLVVLSLLLLATWPVIPGAGTGAAYYIAIGSSVTAFPAPPVVTNSGQRFVSFAVLEALRPGPAAVPAAKPLGPTTAPLGGKRTPERNPGSRSDANNKLRCGGGDSPPSLTTAESVFRRQVAAATYFPCRFAYVNLAGLLTTPAYAASDSTDIPLPGEHLNPDETAQPHSDEEQSAPSQTVPQLLSGPSGNVAAARGGRTRLKLGAHTLDLAGAGQLLGAELNGQPVAAADLLEWGGQRYLSATLLARVGLVLYFDSLDGCYGLCGLVYRVGYDPGQARLTLESLTPLRLSTEQVDDTNAKVEVEGGFFANDKPTELAGDPFLQKLSLKSQPQLGRGFIYLRQPRRTGLRTSADAGHGYGQVDFGNYFRVASYDLTSSGEISLNVELGAPAQVKPQLLDSPPRLVLDFAGVGYVDATQRIAVGRGAAKEIRIGKPQDDTVRVVVELAARRDYRVLSRDGGAKYYVQLFPPGGGATPAHGLSQGRAGRTIMLDAGHGGSDEGAPGVLPGSQEKVNTLAIARAVKAELERLGYRVLLTRSSDSFVSLGARTDYANAQLPYCFVSIHCNSISDPAYVGAMTFHHDNAGPDAIRLAGDVQAAVLAATGAIDKGVRQADFFVLRETVMPAILVECGFMTNKEECGKLCGAPYQALLAKGIANGIDAYVAGR